MTRDLARGTLRMLLLAGLVTVPAGAQQTQTDDLKKEMEALRETLQAIQKDILEIKGMLARQAGARSVIGVVLDVASNPFKGEQTAPLTLVEFSDYQ